MSLSVHHARWPLSKTQRNSKKIIFKIHRWCNPWEICKHSSVVGGRSQILHKHRCSTCMILRPVLCLLFLERWSQQCCIYSMTERGFSTSDDVFFVTLNVVVIVGKQCNFYIFSNTRWTYQIKSYDSVIPQEITFPSVPVSSERVGQHRHSAEERARPVWAAPEATYILSGTLIFWCGAWKAFFFCQISLFLNCTRFINKA